MIIDPLLLPFEEFDEPNKRDIERAIEEQEETDDEEEEAWLYTDALV